MSCCEKMEGKESHSASSSPVLNRSATRIPVYNKTEAGSRSPSLTRSKIPRLGDLPKRTSFSDQDSKKDMYSSSETISPRSISSSLHGSDYSRSLTGSQLSDCSEESCSSSSSYSIPVEEKAQIYTDWANHYLEKNRNKRFISDLQQDITDGVLLADVIEAVTNEKVKDIKSKPKNSAQMVENINSCLTFLSALGVNIEGVCAKDIKEGNLKSILGLFFSLSRFKQQQKALQQQGKEHAAHAKQADVDNQGHNAGRSTPLVNGADNHSRLPSPFKQGSKCPTITNPSTKEVSSPSANNNSRNKSHAINAANDKVTRSQLNQQNNNIPIPSSGSSLLTKTANPGARATSPGTSQVGSGIPTPGGRTLTTRADKQNRVVSTGSTTSTSSTASNKSSTPKTAAPNKNSMLDKFKFFNSKDKSKNKSTLPKSVSKNSTASSSSDAKSTASSARSSSSTDPGVISSSTHSNESESPKLPPKTKAVGKGSVPRRDGAIGAGVDEFGIRQGSSSQGASQQSGHNLIVPGQAPSRKSANVGKVDKKDNSAGQISPSQAKKGSKIGTLIPKSSSSSGKSSKCPTPTSGSGPGTQIPTPSSSIPKPSSGKPASKSGKDSKTARSPQSASSTLPSSSSMSSCLTQKQSITSTPSKSMQNHPLQSQTLPPSHSIIQSKPSPYQVENRLEPSVCKSPVPQSASQAAEIERAKSRSRYTELEYSEGLIERVGDGHFTKPNSNVSTAMKMSTTQPANRSQSAGYSFAQANTAQQGIPPGPQTVNVVKPTCSVSTVATNVLTKSELKSQTPLPMLSRATPPPLPTTEPPQESHVKDKEYKKSNSASSLSSQQAQVSSQSGNNSESDSTPSSNSHSGKSHSSSESVIYKPSSGEEFSGSEMGGSSAANSPRLALKVLQPNLPRPANNVAIVQPRSGEKMETTFDADGKTETIKSDEPVKSSKETTFSETSEKETFVDDAGETIDIKPMQPIMRAMQYGSSGLFRGYGSPQANVGKIFHNPGYATPQMAFYARSNSMGLTRQMMDTPQRYYPGSMRRTLSGGQNSAVDTDYSSDYDTYDYGSGYMSDGDILKGNKLDDTSSGYLSEGGASLYAKRLQQRFREGMQAVKECMQKSSGLLDDDSFDDSSSISSGDISDTINEISTDEGNITAGSSQSDQTNPFGSLKRTPKDLNPNLANGNFHGQYGFQKRGPTLGTSAYLGSDYSSDASPISGWRKYSLPQTNRLLSSDPADYAYLYNGYDHSQWRPNQSNVGQLRKLSNASQPEIHHYRALSADAAECEKIGYSSASDPMTKRDSETNTEQSHLLEASMRRTQNQRGPATNGGQGGYTYQRRPLSNSSIGSNKSGGSGSGKSSVVGSRLAKHGVITSDSSGTQAGAKQDANCGIPRPNSATGLRTSTPNGHRTDMGPEAYSSATLERKKKGSLPTSKSSSAAQTDPGEMYKSNTLGRTKKVYTGPRGPVTRTPSQGENGSICNSTIISNPHATYSKAQGGMYPPSPQTHNGHYVTMDYGSPRNSNAGMWLKNGSPGIMQAGMSETESMDSISSYGSSIQAQIQQARALSGASARILANRELPALPTAGGNTPVHGSNLSLVSSASSLYSTSEEKHNHEVKKLRRELEQAQEKVSTLTTQLSTNAHVVAAFEQSLSNMTNRLQHLTCTAEQKTKGTYGDDIKKSKDSELLELRNTIEALKRQSGLSIPDPVISPNVGRRHTSPGMVPSPQIQPSPQHHHHHPHHGGRAFHTLPMPEGRMTRQMSTDSVSSINSMSSACSMTSQQSAATEGDIGKKKKKKGWLRSSFSKAFSRKKNKSGSMSDCELDCKSFRSNMSAPNSPLMQVHMQNGNSLIKGSHSSSALYEAEDASTVLELRKQLRDKEMKLTDIRLEALSSAHQLEQLRETMNKMKNEMGALKADNDRLQRMVGQRGSNLNTSQSSLPHSRTGSTSDTLERSLSMPEQPSLEMLMAETPDREGKRVTIAVYLGSNPDPSRNLQERLPEILVGSLSVSGKTKWDILDNFIKRVIKEYVLRVDPVTNLGLSAESLQMYHIGEIVRTKSAELPELLPIGYLVGDTMQIGICLKGTKQNSVDSLSFETLIPKSIVQRYVSLLLEHRRIILCGPSGTGKTYLAQKLAEHLVLRSGKELTAGSVATFNVDHKSAKELRQYLANIAEQCENTGVGELPSVIILDNLHHVGSLGEVFNGFLSVKYQKCPYIIGTMNQATCSTTNLQLHHNFRWVLCANHMEPVKGFLGRYLRRRLVEAEVKTGIRNNDLNKIIDWVPKVWLHLNKFLETHSSSDVTIGPRLFLACPMDVAGSKIWFTDLWNYSVIPYMLEAVREGLQVYGRRAPWEDPTDWVMETYPWACTKDEDPALLRIRQEDVGYDSQGVITAGSPKSKTRSDVKGDLDSSDALVNISTPIKHPDEGGNVQEGSHK